MTVSRPGEGCGETGSRPDDRKKLSSVACHPDGFAIDFCCRKSGLEMEEKTLLMVYERDFRDKATKIKLPSESSYLC